MVNLSPDRDGASIEHRLDIPSLHLIGGALCLDFVNTVAYEGTPRERNYLARYADLLAWTQHANIIRELVARELAIRADRDPEAARRAFEQAVSLRLALRRLFLSEAEGDVPDEGDIALISGMLDRAMTGLRLRRTERRYIQCRPPDGDLTRIIDPIIRSVAEVLIHAPLVDIRTCDGCGWMFLDTSRGRRRRWCDMAICGNRAKQQRSHRRAIAAREGPEP